MCFNIFDDAITADGRAIVDVAAQPSLICCKLFSVEIDNLEVSTIAYLGALLLVYGVHSSRKRLIRIDIKSTYLMAGVRALAHDLFSTLQLNADIGRRLPQEEIVYPLVW